MKRTYILIKAGRILDDHSQFYRIEVSEETVQGKRDLDYITALTDREGWFWARNSLEVSAFLEKCISYLLREYGHADIHWKKASARDFVRAEKANLAIPLDVTSESNRRHLLESIDTNYRVYRRLSLKIPK